MLAHGLLGNYRHTWKDFPDLITHDAELNHCDVICWGYPSKLFSSCIRFYGHRAPEIELISDSLIAALNNSEIAGGYSELVLVGHSMGGLVILHTILSLIKPINSKDIKDTKLTKLADRIRHVVLIATPTKGVKPPNILKHLEFLKGPIQIKSLFEGSNFITELNKTLDDLLCKQNESFNYNGREIAFTAVVGDQDNAVTEESARANFKNVEVAEGNHTEVCKPENTEHNSFQALKKAILGSTIPYFINDKNRITQANLTLVKESEKYLYTTGSRGRDLVYFQAIHDQLNKNSDLEYFRVLMGPPWHKLLKDHLVEVLEKYDKRTKLSIINDFQKQPEIFICGNEKRCLVVLPSCGAWTGKYSTAVVFTEPKIVSGYQSLVESLWSHRSGRSIKTIDEVNDLKIVKH